MLSQLLNNAIGPEKVGSQPVAFKFNWRCVSELFGVVFQDYLAYATSACADQKTVPRRFNYFIGD
jgi:hypothetical protein